MYISSELIGEKYKEDPSQMEHTIRPCALCMKEIINAGITRVHMRDELSGAVKSYDVGRLKDMLDDELKRLGGSK